MRTGTFLPWLRLGRDLFFCLNMVRGTGRKGLGTGPWTPIADRLTFLGDDMPLTARHPACFKYYYGRASGHLFYGERAVRMDRLQRRV